VDLVVRWMATLTAFVLLAVGVASDPPFSALWLPALVLALWAWWPRIGT
jgi:hypothetical protein